MSLMIVSGLIGSRQAASAFNCGEGGAQRLHEATGVNDHMWNDHG